MNIKQKTYNFLRQTQKYTGTDNVYLAKGGFWLTSGQIIFSASVFLLAIAFANLLPKETYGTYKYVLSIFGILAIFTLPGMRAAIIRATARGYEGSLIPALKAKIRWGALGGIALLGLAGYYYLNDNIVLAVCFFITAIFLPFLDSLNIYSPLLNGRKLFKISTKYGVISQITAVTMMIAALLLTKNIFIILLTYFISHTLVKFIFLKLTLKKFPPNKKEDAETISYGKYLSFIAILPQIAAHLDKILLWHFLGASQIAIYAFALIPVDRVKGLLGSLKSMAQPKLSQRSGEELKKTLPKKILKLFLIILPIVILYIILAPFLYKIFFPQYLESIIYSQLLALVLLFFPQTFFATALNAQKKKKEIAILQIVMPITIIILLLALIPIYGIMGIILTRLIQCVIHLGLTSYLFKKAM
jgi:O-antigen/teichoic acid export membrane protein